MTKFCVKRPYTVFVAAILVLVLGFVSLSNTQTDLLPDVSMPYMVVVTTYPGAGPEKVESAVTEPLESTLGTVTGVKNVTSTSAENYGIVMLEFEDDTDMDSAMVKVSSALNQAQALLPEECGTPSIMEISMDMVATMYVAVTYDDQDIYQVSDFTEETVIPYLERLNGVASVTDTGLVQKTVEVRLDEDKVNALNDELLAQVNEKFAEAKEELDAARKELEDGQDQLDQSQNQIDSSRAQLNQSKSALDAQANQTYEQLAQASEVLEQLTAYQAQLLSQQANVTALETARQAAVAQLEQNGVSYTEISVLLADAQSGIAQIDSAVAALDASNTVISAMISALGDETVLSEEMLEQLAQILDPEVIELLSSPEAAVEQLKNALAENEQQKSELTAQKETLNQTVTSLSQAQNAISDFDSQITAAKLEVTVTQGIVDQYENQLTGMGVSYTDIEQAKLKAAASFGSADAQISAGQSALENAQQQLDSAKAQMDEGKTALEEAEKNYKTTREEALASANLDQLLNMETLSGLIYAQNFSMPAGYIEDQWLLRIGEEYESVEDISGILLCNVDGIGDVRLEDVAQITLIDNSGETYAKSNGQEAVVLSVFKSSTVGTNTVSSLCNEAFHELEEKYPGLHITVFMDQGDYIDLIVDSLFSNLLWGALLAMIVLLLFLRDVRPTIVVAFSIPFSVLFTIVLMYFSGISINMISLSGLTLGIGMLVDNSVVVIENIYRLRSRGVSIGRAAVQGAKQVAGAITASTLTTICVFLPLVFSNGITRELLTDMGLTITYSLLASLVVALTVVPTMSNTILKKNTPKEHKLFDAMLAGYRKALEFCLRFKVVPLVVSVILLVWSVVTVLRTGIVLLPDTGSNQVEVMMTVPEDTTREDAYQMADRVMVEALALDDVETVGGLNSAATTSMLTSTSSGGDNYTGFSFFITLKDGADADAVSDQLTEALSDLDCEELMIGASSSSSMSSYMSSGLQINLYGKDLEDLVSASEDLMEIVDQVEGFEEISNGQEEGKETLQLLIDQDQVMGWGLTNAQIYQEISDAMKTEYASASVTLDGSDMDVIVVDERNTLTQDNLLELPFEVEVQEEDGTTNTEIHYLREFAKLEHSKGVVSISRENQTRMISVTATTAEGYNTTLLSRELEDLLDEYEAPEGITVEFGGETSSVSEMVSQMVQMIALALVFIYLIMVAQFQSLLSPFIVLFTIPLAFTGGMLGLMIAGENLSMMSMMGFLVLAGVVVNNGIVFVDYTNQLRYGGLSKREALIATGCTRMRPILMTTLTTVFAMMTMLFSHDAGSAMGRGLAIVVVGGLLYATLMTLFVVPVMYDILFRRKEMKEIDVGDHDMDQLPDDAAEYAAIFRKKPETAAQAEDARQI